MQGLATNCIIRGDYVPRAEIGNATSNDEQIHEFATMDMRMNSFTVCESDQGVLTGIQFTLMSDNLTALVLDPLGDISGQCRTLDLEDGGV